MITKSQRQLDSSFHSKYIFLQIFAGIYLLLSFSLSSVYAINNTGYIKGMGAVLREHPSIQSKNSFKLKRGTKVLSLVNKGIWQKVKTGENQGWILRGQISKFPVKRKKLILGQKIKLHSVSGRRLRLRTFSAVVGVKGLLDSKGKKISPFKTDYAALEWLENQPFNEEESVKFLTLTE